MRVLVLGAGYVGGALAIQLTARGHKVEAVSRTSGVDITNIADLKRLGRDWDWVVNTVSSSRGGVEDYRRVFLEGTRHIIEWLSGSRLQKYVYTSSTSVYGQTEGSWVDETSLTQPHSETSRILFETEKLLSDLPAVILRVAGIYGPERGHLFQQYLKNEARIAGKGERLINMIHRDDVVGCIIAALTNGRPGEIYNAVDDEPVTQKVFFEGLADSLHKPMPPFCPDRTTSERKRGATNKRVLNQKLKPSRPAARC